MEASPPICDFGWPAPEFALPGTDGQTHRLDGICGPKGTLVMFICNHCPYVLGALDRILRDAGDLQDMGIGVAAICSNDATSHPADSFENMVRLAETRAFPFPYLHDESQQVARAWGAACTPDFFGFDADLGLQYRGRLDAARPEARTESRRDLYEAMAHVAQGGQGPRDQIPLDRLFDQMEDRVLMRIVFDLDGTLIDSAPDILDAVNGMLEAEGCARLDLPTLISFIGNGLPHLVRLTMEARDIDPARHPELSRDVARRYNTVNGVRTRLYPGVAGALEHLRTKGHRLAICTNKPEAPARDILRVFGLLDLFVTVIGGDSLPQRKPDPAPLRAAFDGDAGFYVGDSEVDAETARAAGCPFALFTEGYRKGPVTELPRRWAFAAFDRLPAIAEEAEASHDALQGRRA